jgi:hypothetical protein
MRSRRIAWRSYVTFPLILTLGVSAAVAYAVHAMIKRAATKAGGVPMFFGLVPVRPALAVLGILGALMLPGMLGLGAAVIGLGAALPPVFASADITGAPQLTDTTIDYGDTNPETGRWYDWYVDQGNVIVETVQDMLTGKRLAAAP